MFHFLGKFLDFWAESLKSCADMHFNIIYPKKQNIIQKSDVFFIFWPKNLKTEIQNLHLISKTSSFKEKTWNQGAQFGN